MAVTPALDPDPFFHGTKADLQPGDLLRAGFRSNYRPDVVMNHIYFTALADGAGLAAELAGGEGTPRVYEVEVPDSPEPRGAGGLENATLGAPQARTRRDHQLTCRR